MKELLARSQRATILWKFASACIIAVSLFFSLWLGLLVGKEVAIVLERAIVSRDAGFYIPTAHRFADGWILYRDIWAAYTPLVIEIFAIAIRVAARSEPFNVILHTVVISEIIAAGITSLIAYKFIRSIPSSLLAGLTVLYLMLHLEGAEIILEPLTVLFLLLSTVCWFAPHRGYAAGFFLALAFLCKQYALLMVIGPLLASILSPRSKNQLTMVRAATSSFVTVLIALGYYSIRSGTSPSEIFSTVYFTNYLDRTASLDGLKRFLFNIAPAALITPSLLLVRRFRTDYAFVMLLGATAGLTLPLLVRDFDHYMLLPLPFAILLTWRAISLIVQDIAVRLVLVNVVCALSVNHFYPASPLARSAITREEQIALRDQIRGHWKDKKSTLVFGDPWMRALLDPLPASAERPSYGFLSHFSKQQIFASLQSTPRTLVLDQNQVRPRNSDIPLTASMIRDQLLAADACMVATVSSWELWERPCPK